MSERFLNSMFKYQLVRDPHENDYFSFVLMPALGQKWSYKLLSNHKLYLSLLIIFSLVLYYVNFQKICVLNIEIILPMYL